MGQTVEKGMKKRKPDEQGMKLVREFDQRMIDMDDFGFLMMRIMAGVFAVIGGIVILLADTAEVQFACLGFLFLASLMPLYLSKFMVVREGKDPAHLEGISIYHKLRWLPVDYYDIYRVRLEYIMSYCKKFTLVLLIIKVIIAIGTRHFSIGVIAYPLGAGLVLVITGWLYIYPRKKLR